MGVEKEIIVYRKAGCESTDPLRLITLLEQQSWKNLLEFLDVGDEFDWINAEQNEEGIAFFHEIMNTKNSRNEFISFRMFHTILERYVIIHIDHERIFFDLDLSRTEDVQYWFGLFHSILVEPIIDYFPDIKRIEWCYGYNGTDVIRSWDY